MQNPFDITFGKKPIEQIQRFAEIDEITNSFSLDPISQQVYMITGVRGSGKTVLLNTVSNYFEAQNNWIVVRLSPEQSLLQALMQKMYHDAGCKLLFAKAKLTLSVPGVGLQIENGAPESDASIHVEQMLKILKKNGKRILVAIDEVTNNDNVRLFASMFQIYIGQELPIFLLMTGLYENIEELQNEKSLTFLYRAPKIKLKPLSLSSIASRYETVFGIDRAEALALARMTRGYSFGFQALGYSIWENKERPNLYKEQYRDLLNEYVYEKIWSSLSAKDKYILYGLANCPDGRVKSVVDFLNLEPYEINQYRKRLIRRGIISGEEYGRLHFLLPLFEDFILDNADERGIAEWRDRKRSK